MNFWQNPTALLRSFLYNKNKRFYKTVSKMKMGPKMKTTLEMKMNPKIKIHPKIKMTSIEKMNRTEKLTWLVKLVFEHWKEGCSCKLWIIYSRFTQISSSWAAHWQIVGNSGAPELWDFIYSKCKLESCPFWTKTCSLWTCFGKKYPKNEVELALTLDKNFRFSKVLLSPTF